MTDEGTPQNSPNLTDEEILKRADMITEARKLEQEEKQRQIEEEKAKQAAEAERIRKEQEAEAAAKLAEANRIQEEEKAKKAAELKKAHELVDAEKAAQPKKKKHTAAKIILAIVILLIIFCGVAILSHEVTCTQVSTTSLPYQAHYTVWLQQGTTNVAGLSLDLVGDANQMMATMPGLPTATLKQGESFKTNTYNLVLSLFWGAWKVYDITGNAEMTYKGISTDNLVTFDTVISTNKQIPEFLFNIIMSMSGIKYANA